nr:kinesin heavy chain isoform X9 [Crassostrea gigas]
MPQIRTLCRIKPTAEYYPEFEASRNTLYLRVPEVLRENWENSVRGKANVSHEFNFDYIFKNTATQEEVFEVAAKEIIQAFLNGYNGTIFAYGQTGTGKTFTVEGSPKQYKLRGLEPRSLSMIYKELEKRTDEDISVHISYLEIYKETGFDLLSTGARTQSAVTPFPKVSVMEGSQGVWMVKNLSVHYAATEDVAQNLLLQGQANRRVAATAVHDRSSRSHAVFTIQLSSKRSDSDVVVKSKLHLVDLAGSERVSKTGAQGNLLNEAKCINLSLHFLESVIIALQGDSGGNDNKGRVSSAGHQRGRSKTRENGRPSTAEGLSRTGPRHVPYRNSLLTMVLRDSLGGNCMTCMIATISLEYRNLGETLSTCRFAGRVACIANSVKRNEEVDEKALIKKLRKRVAELESELSCLLMAKEDVKFSIDMMNAKLTDEDKIQCNKVIKSYLDGKVADPVSEGITNPYKFRECMKILKKMILEGLGSSANPDDVPNFLMSSEEANDIRASSTPEKGAQVLKVHSDKRKNEEKTVQIPIPARNAWGEESYTTAPEPPLNRPHHRQRRRPHRPPQDTDEEGMRTAGESDAEPAPKQSDAENLSTILRQSRSRNRRKYHSPFEKKRIKEIKKLNEKVETLQQTQISKEGELVKMKINMAEQELNLMEEQVRTKLNVTKEQLADQRAYLQQLKTVEADKLTIEREKTVEKQLRKKEAKATKKIEVIEEKRKQLVEHSEEVDKELTKAKPTVREQFGKYRKRDGSLNTRQVYDMLRSEEKKQEKIQNQLEHERMVMISQQLELKEAATRQKLQNFKELLRLSHSAGFPDGHVGHANDPRAVTAPGFGEGPERLKAREEVGLEDMHERTGSPERTLYTAATTHINNGLESRNIHTRESRAITQKEEPMDSRPVSRQSVRSTRSVIPDSEFYAKRKQEKDPTSRWESSYSRPSTACSQKQPEIDFIYMQPKKLDDSEDEIKYGLTDDVKSAREESRKSTARSKPPPAPSRSSNRIDDGLEDFETLIPSEYVHGMGTKDKFDGKKMGLSSTTFDAALASMLEAAEENVYFNHEDYDQYASTNKTRSYDRESPMDREMYAISQRSRENDIRAIYGSPLKSSKSMRQSRPKTQQKPVSYFSDDEDFDGRPRRSNSPSRVKRDKSLEDWERRMLQKNSARSSRKNSPLKKSKSNNYASNRYSTESEEEEVKKNPSSYRNWGPQTKNASIAGRLANFSIKTPPPKNNADVNGEYYYPSRTNSLVIEESKFKSVTAVPDEEAESSFMGKVIEQRDRVNKIRQARKSAEVIQMAWRKYQEKKKHARW